MGVKENLELMQTLDDAWNSQNWEVFRKRHSEDTNVFWPGQPDPTKGLYNHEVESKEFFKTFPDNHIMNNPYKISFGEGDWTCSIADFTGTMKGSSGKIIPPTNRSFKVEFCTVAHWKNGEIVAERLFYDLVGLMK